ncbi:hypothetical protein NEOLI_003449 [Neolecta irregularis DAH-3]|uniref:F-box domain-containing protein n=1 Tax=Neolecta irregularis (strain DAH-3) TaxID=1198029 RepID=A0A1U7LHR9_NEOID|nr:hypothetical protein NEOLI_003449 [Neolecta irregularis DAH-3]|eukprot:OLL22197.1 hypothetical protein NEOLI_003449 [Neolecta irregularis DAH-3]
MALSFHSSSLPDWLIQRLFVSLPTRKDKLNLLLVNRSFAHFGIRDLYKNIELVTLLPQYTPKHSKDSIDIDKSWIALENVEPAFVNSLIKHSSSVESLTIGFISNFCKEENVVKLLDGWTRFLVIATQIRHINLIVQPFAFKREYWREPRACLPETANCRFMDLTRAIGKLPRLQTIGYYAGFRSDDQFTAWYHQNLISYFGEFITSVHMTEDYPTLAGAYAILDRCYDTQISQLTIRIPESTPDTEEICAAVLERLALALLGLESLEEVTIHGIWPFDYASGNLSCLNVHLSTYMSEEIDEICNNFPNLEKLIIEVPNEEHEDPEPKHSIQPSRWRQLRRLKLIGHFAQDFIANLLPLARLIELREH